MSGLMYNFQLSPFGLGTGGGVAMGYKANVDIDTPTWNMCRVAYLYSYKALLAYLSLSPSPHPSEIVNLNVT